VAELYPQALGTHFSRLLQHAWMFQWDYSLIPATTRETNHCISPKTVPVLIQFVLCSLGNYELDCDYVCSLFNENFSVTETSSVKIVKSLYCVLLPFCVLNLLYIHPAL
jgi:hypothetical protein